MLRITLKLMFLCLIMVPVCGRAQITAIRAGRIIDPDTGKTEANHIILVGKDNGPGFRSQHPRRCVGP